MYMDCDRDSLIYLSDPIGPACHTNAPTCYFTQLDASSGEMRSAGDHHSQAHVPMTTLFALERTIAQRRAEAEAGTSAGGVKGRQGSGGRADLQGGSAGNATRGACPLLGRLLSLRPPTPSACLPCASPPPGGKPSWTAKLLADPQLLCKKVREEAGELCQTLEADEGKERAASEAADLIYHAMVLLKKQGRAGGSRVHVIAVLWQHWHPALLRVTCCVRASAQQLPGSMHGSSPMP